MINESDEDHLAQWRKTYEKQRRTLLKRGPIENEDGINSAVTPLGKILKTSEVPTAKVPELRPVSPRVAAIIAARYALTSQVGTVPIQATISDAEPRGESLTTSPPRRRECPVLSTPADNGGHESICHAIGSLNISSPRTESPSRPPHQPRYPAPPPSPSASPGKQKKYYVVASGKCTGVFDNWPYVQSLTSGVSGNCQKSYPTYDEALEVYLDLKARGLVKIVRNRGDKRTFGSLSNAMQ